MECTELWTHSPSLCALSLPPSSLHPIPSHSQTQRHSGAAFRLSPVPGTEGGGTQREGERDAEKDSCVCICVCDCVCVCALLRFLILSAYPSVALVRVLTSSCLSAWLLWQFSSQSPLFFLSPSQHRQYSGFPGPSWCPAKGRPRNSIRCLSARSLWALKRHSVCLFLHVSIAT